MRCYPLDYRRLQAASCIKGHRRCAAGLAAAVFRVAVVGFALPLLLAPHGSADAGDSHGVANDAIPSHLDITRDAPREIAPVDAPFDMPQPKRPRFADRTFDIRDFGAVPGGREPCTEAIAQAIDVCSKAGGGRVVVPRGHWLTGPIHLHSNVNLHLADGAVVCFSQRYEDYLPVVLIQRGGVRCYNYSPPIYAKDCRNVAVTGEGDALFDGQGQKWWPWKHRQPSMNHLMQTAGRGTTVDQRVFGTPDDGVRPPFVQFYGCKNVLLEGFTIKDGPSWTLHPVYCENVIARRLKVLTVGVPNGDGFDPDSCKNVLIEYCYFDNGDDCICLKAGRNEDAWEVGVPCENVVVRHCAVRRGHGAFVIGSEMSAGVRNVLVHDLRVDGCARAIRIKTQPGRGGFIENIFIRDVDVASVTSYAIVVTMRYPNGPAVTMPHPPVVRNIHIERLRCRKASTAIGIAGLPNSPIEALHFENLDMRANRGVRCQMARGVQFRRVNIDTQAAPLFWFNHAQDVTIANSAAPAGLKTFVSLEGESNRVRLLRNELPGDVTPVRLADDVPDEAAVLVPPSQQKTP